MKALVLIDLQNDFMPGGALAVPGGEEIIGRINALQDNFDLVVATQDWHPADHSSFAENHEDKEEYQIITYNGREQVLWPVHCVQNTGGAQFHAHLNTHKLEAIFRKGTSPEIDSYSGFYDNGHLKATGLAGYLRERGADELYFCGLAGEYCVYYSIMDALEEGFKAILIEDATRALKPADFEEAKKRILDKGGEITQANKVM